MQKAYKLQGKHRHYDWGGTQFIPALMGVDNPNNEPYAEYWMGVHPAAVSEIYSVMCRPYRASAEPEPARQ